MRASRLFSRWSSVRSLRFRRIPFRRDVAFDPGGATAPRITVPHMLPSTIMTGSASDVIDCETQSHTPADRYVRFAIAVTDNYATLATGRPATAFPVPVFHRLERASFA